MKVKAIGNVTVAVCMKCAYRYTALDYLRLDLVAMVIPKIPAAGMSLIEARSCKLCHELVTAEMRKIAKVQEISTAVLLNALMLEVSQLCDCPGCRHGRAH